jgi:8-oxo-dGTP pyrophosphatase MutT (NUDIX family)
MPGDVRIERSAGGVVFRLGAGDVVDVVLIRTHEGRWQLPKGWIEDGERPERTAVREVREEAGVEAEVVAPLDTIEYWYRSTYTDPPARVHKYVTFFLLRYLSGSTDDHDDEVLEARWAPIDEAERMLAFNDERRMVAQARALIARAVRETG